MNHKIFLQSHLDINSTNKYMDIIKVLFNNDSKYYELININDKTELKNIHELSRFMNEYCLYYYIYENNLYKDLDIISLGSYRRFPAINNILLDMIYYGNYIQYYEEFTYRYNNFTSMINQDTLYNKYKNTFFYVYLYFRSFNFPDFVIEDLIEYLETQKILDINDIYELHKIGVKYTFYARSLISLKINEFETLMEFTNGYFDFIRKKYNFNIFNYNELYDWYFKYIIKYLQEENITNSQKYFNSPDRIKIRYRLYGTEKDYNKILDKDSDTYGLKSYCNCYRYFGYIFEWLINCYINVSKNKKIKNKKLIKIKYKDINIFTNM